MQLHGAARELASESRSAAVRMHRAREVMRHGTTTVAAAAARPRCCRRRADQRRSLRGESNCSGNRGATKLAKHLNETSETPKESRRTCVLIRESCHSVDEETGCYYVAEGFLRVPATPRLAALIKRWGIMARDASRRGAVRHKVGAAQGVSQSPNAPEQRMPRSLRRKSLLGRCLSRLLRTLAPRRALVATLSTTKHETAGTGAT